MGRSFMATGTVLLLVIGATIAEGNDPALAPPPRMIPLDELVRQLGSDDFAEREAATGRLSKLPTDVPPPELLEAAKSADPEVRRRASDAVKALRARAEARALGRERVFAKQGTIDLFVASTKVWDIPVKDDRLWQATLDVGMALVRKLPEVPKSTPVDPGKYGWSPQKGRKPVTPVGFWKFAPEPLLIRSNEPYRITSILPGGIRASDVVASAALSRNLVVADGSLRAESYISESIILSNGSVTTASYLSHAIVVCDGDVEVTESLQSSVVIARGNITVHKYAHVSNLIAGGKVLIVGTAPPNLRPANVIQENARKPLDFVTFFELATVGVEVKLADKAVRITSVAADKPFADAGVRVGDIVAEVNGKKPDSPEALRRLLRDALAIGDATVKLQRGDKTVTVKVALPE